ncbi:MAG TPA: RNA 2',3'-cyclic phosphodiesterase [Edaphobacter sp.]|nr:RNA 2',3'-cyclic phosphodiesterase [Edaphobacter sp.]
MRLFVGLPLADSLVRELKAVVARLRSKDDQLRWPPPESWHITLQFLGSTRHDQYECLHARLSELQRPPVPIRIDTVDLFDRAGILFAGVRSSQELTSLERHVVAATALCGFLPENRPYHPHITLARSKGRAGQHVLHQLKNRLRSPPEFTASIAEEFLLYESIPTPTGSRYEIRERFKLQAFVSEQ